MLHPLMQSLKWDFAQAPGASVVQHSLPLHQHGSVPCLGHSLGKKQAALRLEAKTEIYAHQLLFLALPPRSCGPQSAWEVARLPIPAPAKPALLSHCQHCPAAVPVFCAHRHQPRDINPWV